MILSAQEARIRLIYASKLYNCCIKFCKEVIEQLDSQNIKHWGLLWTANFGIVMSLHAKGEYKKALDHLKICLPFAKTYEKIINVYWMDARCNENLDLDKAIKSYDEAIKLCKQYDYKDLEIEINMNRAGLLHDEMLWKKMYTLYCNNKQRYEFLNDSVWENKIRILIYNNQIEQARELLDLINDDILKDELINKFFTE